MPHAIIMVLALTGFITSADVASGQVTVYGTNTTCADWVEARTTRRAQILETWAQGTLNGIAFGSNIDFWRSPKGAIEPNQAYLWLDRWCRDNPLGFLIGGVVALFDERTDNRRHQQLPR